MESEAKILVGIRKENRVPPDERLLKIVEDINKRIQATAEVVQDLVSRVNELEKWVIDVDNSS